MPTFRQGDVVRVPFPYTDRHTRQHRPAMVVSEGPLGNEGALFWAVMITAAQNRGWPGDCEIEAFKEAGLPIPSIVRPAKIAVIEIKDAEFVGRVQDEILTQVLETIAGLLGR